MAGLARFRARNHPQQLLLYGSDDLTDDRATRWAWFRELDAEFHFDLDVAASANNAKCERCYTKDDNGLEQPWFGRVWCNPPYSDIRSWVEKAWASWRDCEVIVMCLPANRTEQAWWQDLVEPERDNGGVLTVRFVRDRQRFVQAGKDRIEKNERAPFGVCLLIWAPPAVGG
jgi:phage N-6-adenine-methyltransferase